MLGNTKTSGYHIWLPSGFFINAKIRWAKIFTENAAKQNHCKCLRALKKPMWDILRYLHMRIYEGSTLVNQVMRHPRPGRKQTSMRWVRGVTDSEFCVTSNGWNLETSSAHVWPCFNIATWRTERMSFKNPVSKNNRSKKSIILTQAIYIYIPNIEKTLCLHKHVINNFHTFKNFLHPVESTPSYHNPRLYRLHPLGASAAWIRWLRMAKRRIRWG